MCDELSWHAERLWVLAQEPIREVEVGPDHIGTDDKIVVLVSTEITNLETGKSISD
jgi:hypothetical protein